MRDEPQSRGEAETATLKKRVGLLLLLRRGVPLDDRKKDVRCFTTGKVVFEVEYTKERELAEACPRVGVYGYTKASVGGSDFGGDPS